MDKAAFMRSDEKNYISSNLLYHYTKILNINEDMCCLPIGTILGHEELMRFADNLYDQLAMVNSHTEEEKEARAYIRKVASILRQWAREGYSLRMV